MRKLIVRNRDGANDTIEHDRRAVYGAGRGRGNRFLRSLCPGVPPGAGPPCILTPGTRRFTCWRANSFSVRQAGYKAIVGTFVHFPANSPHHFASRGGTATILSFTFHPGAAAFFRESNRINSDILAILRSSWLCPADTAFACSKALTISSTG